MIHEKNSWLYVGQAIFGLLVGVTVGMSKTPIVATLLGLLFAFIGGSVIVMIKGRTEGELELMGKCITALALFTLLGIWVGVSVRANDLLSYTDDAHSIIDIEGVMTVSDIRKQGKKPEYVNLVCEIVKQQQKAYDPKTSNSDVKVNTKNLESMFEDKVDSRIIHAWLGHDIDCQTGERMLQKGKGSFLYRNKIVVSDE